MYAEGMGGCNRKYMCGVKGRSSQVRTRLTRSGEFYVLHLPYRVYVHLHLLVPYINMRGVGQRCG